MRSPHYQVWIEYTTANGEHGDYIAEEDLKTDTLLLAAKMVGFYQGRNCKINRLLITDQKKNENILLPPGLFNLY